MGRSRTARSSLAGAFRRRYTCRWHRYEVCCVYVGDIEQLGRYKWHQLGIPYTLEDVQSPENELVERACAVFRSAGLRAY
jgi:hypothetical protein